MPSCRSPLGSADVVELPALAVLISLVIAYLGYSLAGKVNHVVSEGLPGNTLEQQLTTAATYLGQIVLLLGCLSALTKRVILDGDGVHLAWLWRRRSFAWDKIDDITLRSTFNGRWLTPYLHTSSGRHRIGALNCPVLFVPVWSSDTFSEAPDFTPKSLREPYQRLREEWLRHRDARVR